MKVSFVDRAAAQTKQEKIYGDAAIRFLYETGPGYLLERAILSQKPLSYLYGIFNNSPLSARRIPCFIKEFEIDLSLFEVPKNGFQNFNEFFIRKYKPGIRSFPSLARELGAPAEARYFAWNQISKTDFFPIKGKSLSLPLLLGSEELAQKFDRGSALVARLCPVDYHRFHFPDSGVPSASVRIEGGLHSVNPMALSRLPTLFQENERMVSTLDSKNFGKIAFVEVGAMCVGKIQQTYQPNVFIDRGHEKGFFLFGASTVVIFFEPGKIRLDDDLILNTKNGIETLVRLGEKIGSV